MPVCARPPVPSLAVAALALVPAAAHAWEVEDPLHASCHERFVAAALDEIGYRGGATPPAPSADEELFIDRQQFDASPYPRNLHALALVLGARSNDVRGLADFDLTGLAAAARRLGGRAALRVCAFELAVPVPQTRGWPITHPQYRFAVGLEF